MPAFSRAAASALCPVAHPGQDEVRLGGRHRDATTAELRDQARALGEDQVARALDVRAVLQRRDRRDLAEAVHVVGRAHPVQPVDGLGAGDRVADPEPGEAGDLGERAQRDHRRPLGHEGRAVRGLGVVAEVAIRLVEDHQRRLGAEPVQEADERAAPNDGRRRVVGRADEHRLGAGGHALRHVVQVRLVAARAGSSPRWRPTARPRCRRARRRGAAGAPRRPARRPRERSAPSSSSAPLPTRSQSGLTRSHSPEGLAHRRGAAVRVEVDVRRLPPERLHHPRGRAEGVLVGREPDDGGKPQLLLEPARGTCPPGRA